MEKNFGFKNRLLSMMKMDFKRTSTGYRALIFIGIALIMPVLILVMTTSMAKEGEQSFTNTWCAMESVSGTATGMDMTSMCNINLVFFLSIIFADLFIADDFKSGFAKNIFTVRSNKWDYVLSKVIVLSIFGMILLLAYFIGNIIGGAIAGLSFDTEGFGVSGIIFCLLSKMFFMVFMVGMATLASTFGKSRYWLCVILSLALGMLLFTMISSITPLNSGIMNVILCLAGGCGFGVGFSALGTIILNKLRIV